MRRKSSTEIVNRILSKSGGLRARVNAHCVSCIYDPYSSGTWRKQVEECEVKGCPLYSVRPRSSRNKSSKPISTIYPDSVDCEDEPKTGKLAT